MGASFKEPVLQIISGTVFNDADGLTDGNISQSGSVNNPGTNVGGTLFANLLNSSNLVVASKPIDVNGSYLFDNVPVGTYSVQLTTNSSAGTYTTPLAPPPTALPAGWVNTGEFNGVGAGNDGSADGMTASIGIISLDIKGDNNFGIERLPDSKPITALITTPVVGESITLTTPSAQRFGSLPILAGSDPEDQPTEAVLTGKSVQFTTLATVGSSNTPAILMYNGVAITLNQIIPNFNSDLLTVSLPNPWAGSGLKFSYAYVDAAGKADPTPALYQLRWTGGGTLVINLSEFVVTKNNCTANLNWKTSSEINSDRFEVEVSTGANPVYTTVSTILASGSSSSTKAYQFNYQMQSGVTYYFRLKMIDKDGSFTYSNIQSANCSKGGGIVIAPNPVINMFTVKGMENGKNTIFVYAADGQLVKTQTSTTNNTVVNITNLAPGMYTVKVTSEAGNAVINKLIKY